MPDREAALRKYRAGRARSVYDRVSPGARDSRWQRRFERYLNLRKECVAKLALRKGETVLDVGCGAGLSFAELQNAVGSEGRIIGIEHSQEQLAAARALVERSGWNNILLVSSSVEDAEFSGEADAALFSFTHDIMRTPHALQNVVAHLKPGARIVAFGVKWAPWWRLLTNWRTWRGSRGFVTTFEGFRKPWSNLETMISSLEAKCAIESTPVVGRVGLYIAFGKK